MKAANLKSLLLVGLLIVLSAGCVSNKRHNRELNAVQSQVNSLSSEVARLEAEAQASKNKSGLSSFVQQFTTPAPVSKPSVGFASSAVYRTPSGFELPAADIQRALKGAGYYNGDVDGKIGPKTREAIRAFQKDNDLTPDGVCGKKTWDLLKTHLDSSIPVIK